VDIIADLGGKLLFVECKTQISSPTDIDKFNSVVRKYGGLGSKALFVTYEPMKDDIRDNCKKYGIITYSFKNAGNSTDGVLTMMLERLISTDNI